MDEIATEAGVARSTLYVYFANRDELLRACLQRMHTLLLHDVVARGSARATPARGGCGPLVLGMLERIDENPAFFRLALATQGSRRPGGRWRSAPSSPASASTWRGILEDLVAEGSTGGDFRQIDPARAGALIGQQLFGAMTVRAGDPSARPLDAEVEDVFEFLLRGLAS